MEVMTVRKPKSTVELVLWCGNKYLKDATSITAGRLGHGEATL